MKYFVREDSIVREIWGKSDTVLLIFAGASAEFALNKSVDWLYFTGRLPADPLGRLFSTVSYSRKIIFSSLEEATASIDQISRIHSSVESARGRVIPDWAYRDVLFMLIYYSIASFELLERKLTAEEKEEVVEVFIRVGNRMHIPGLPSDYAGWKVMYFLQIRENLENSAFALDLYRQYRKHLGPLRYFLLLELQKVVVSDHVRHLLRLRKTSLITPMIFIYRVFRKWKAEWLIKSLVLPAAYKEKIRQLDMPPAG